LIVITAQVGDEYPDYVEFDQCASGMPGANILTRNY